MFATGEIVSASTLNTYVANNLSYLYSLAHGSTGALIPGTNFSTSSTSFVDWNGATPLTLSFTKRGGTETALFVVVHGQFHAPSTCLAFFAVRIGATDYSGAGIPHVTDSGVRVGHSEEIPITGLAAGSYTLKLRVKVQSPSYTYQADAGNDYAQLSAKEIFYG